MKIAMPLALGFFITFQCIAAQDLDRTAPAVSLIKAGYGSKSLNLHTDACLMPTHSRENVGNNFNVLGSGSLGHCSANCVNPFPGRA